MFLAAPDLISGTGADIVSSKRENVGSAAVGLVILAVAGLVFIFLGGTVLASAIILAIGLWQISRLLCLAVHVVVGLSGWFGYTVTDGLSIFPWWSWIVGAPFLAWAGVVGVMATVGVLMFGLFKLLGR